MSRKWKCRGCRKPLVIKKRILDKGGTVKCGCGEETNFSKKENGKVIIS